jgi:CRISPR-associated protein Cmr4
MKAHLYKMECLTNMHVGGGEANYNIIDNEVELDCVLQVPTINSSGVKGALRSHFEKKMDKVTIKKLFGGKCDTSKGEYKFMSANIIARPVRVSGGNAAYVNVTCVPIIETQLLLLKSLGIVTSSGVTLPSIPDGYDFISGANVTAVEGFTAKGKENNEGLKNLIGANWALCGFELLAGIELPVSARNVLKDGISKNLWYEQIVPHKSIFHFIVLTPEAENQLDSCLAVQDGEVIQFGGNASIGQGFAKVTKVGESK